MKIHIKQLPCTFDELCVQVLTHFMERVKHRNTIGSPAPIADLEIVRVVCDAIEANEPLEFDGQVSADKVVAAAEDEYREERFRAAVEQEKQRLRDIDGVPAPTPSPSTMPVVVSRASVAPSLLDFIA